VAARALETACWWKIGEIEESSAQQFQDRARSHGKTRRGPRTEARWWVRSGTEYYFVPRVWNRSVHIYIYMNMNMMMITDHRVVVVVEFAAGGGGGGGTIMILVRLPV